MSATGIAARPALPAEAVDPVRDMGAEVTEDVEARCGWDAGLQKKSRSECCSFISIGKF